MSLIEFKILKSNDFDSFELIADWYLNEWNFPIDKTIERLKKITEDRLQFQVVMTIDDLPISTGGIYNHVGLLDKEPKFKIYKNWLALVYTVPEQRHNGYGKLICEHIQNHSISIGLNHLHLFTDTAERLYTRLGWTKLERLQVDSRNIVVMDKRFDHKKTTANTVYSK